jgi:hypothetical protein
LCGISLTLTERIATLSLSMRTVALYFTRSSSSWQTPLSSILCQFHQGSAYVWPPIRSRTYPNQPLFFTWPNTCRPCQCRLRRTPSPRHNSPVSTRRILLPRTAANIHTLAQRANAGTFLSPEACSSSSAERSRILFSIILFGLHTAICIV